MRWVQKLDTVFRVRRTDQPDQGVLGPYARIGDARAARTVEANRHANRGRWGGHRPATEPTYDVEVAVVQEWAVVPDGVRPEAVLAEHPVRGPHIDDGRELVNSVELQHLRDRDQILARLEAGGVDNWEGFGEALSAALTD
jgi:hypothetical protein